MVKFIKGDILEQDVDIIAHQVNTIGIMGAGLAGQISAKYPDAYITYKQYCNINKNNLILGDFLPIVIYNETYKKKQLLLNCFTQNGTNLKNERHTDNEAIKICFNRIKEEIKKAFPNKKIIMAIPYMYGCGLADGNWDEILPIFIDIFGGDNDIELLVCKYF